MTAETLKLSNTGGERNHRTHIHAGTARPTARTCVRLQRRHRRETSTSFGPRELLAGSPEAPTAMARQSSSSSSSGAWRYLNPAYYLKRPKRLVLLFFVFVAATFAFWDSQSLVSKYEVYPEGTHIVIPWFERPIIYDVRTRPNLVESTSGSRDLQMVTFPCLDPSSPSADCGASRFWGFSPPCCGAYLCLLLCIGGTNTWDRFEMRVHKRVFDLVNQKEL